MKMKHNKKRNTAFLYECLIKQLTKYIVREDNANKKIVLEIIKKYFGGNAILKKELNIYQSVLESKKMNHDFSKRFLHETKKDFESLDRKTVFNKQTELLNEMRGSFSNSIFANFVSNYKDLANVGQYFSSSQLDAKRRLLIEDRIINILTSDTTQIKEMKHIDNLTYKTFVNKFNESYSNTLRKEQKDLLMNYITSFSDNGLGLKSFLNEEVGRLKNQIQQSLESKTIKENKGYLQKTQRILDKLNSFSKTPITEQVVKDVFYIQDLVAEVNK
jgi:hypothetical protein